MAYTVTELTPEYKSNQNTFLVYGRSGTGKSTSLLTLPRPLILFDIESGLTSLLPHIKQDNNGITVVNGVESFADLMDAIKRISAAGIDIASIAIDTLTTLQTFAMNDKFMEKAQVTQRDWGESLQALRFVTRTMLKSNVAFVCLAHEDEGEMGSIKPAFAGRMKNEAGCYFDYVFRSVYNGNDDKYYWETKHANHVTKARGVVLPQYIQQDYQKVISLNKPMEG